jgi:hypothetical protein
VKAIPDAIDRMLPVFNTRKCRFANEPDKVDTSRLVVFKEFGIYCSYILACSFFGSDHLRKMKPIYEKLYSPQFLEDLQIKYMILHNREQVYFNHEILESAAEDLMRGINLASKKKPVLQHWFVNEPDNLIDIHVNSKRDTDGKVEEEPPQDANDRRWKPTGGIS